ncbi:MAG: ABC transporter permease [Acidobacteriia bacterium]|nr:ABC transporter permease [Terriglobia bacterium]
MDTLLQDLRVAVRALARKPGVTLLAVASLGLAIGFSTAAFSVLDAYALRDLPVSAPGQLVWLSATTREQRSDILSWPEYEALAARTHCFTGILTENRRGPRVKLPDRDQFPITAGVSDNYFDLLGVKPAKGELFHAGKGQDGVMVISDRYWHQTLEGDAAILGRSLPVGSGVLKIIGVLPPGFHGIRRGIAVDLFVPMQGFFGSLQMARANSLRFTDYEAIARLRPGTGIEQAQKEADAALRQLEKDGLAAAPDRKAAVERFTTKGLRDKVESNAAFLGLMVLLVLIAAANLANLRLVDNEGRRRETGIRLALGAGRTDLARQHLVETLLLSGSGTAVGLLLAAWLIQAAPALFYAGQSYIDYSIRLDLRTFGFSSIALVAVAVIGAAIPWSDAWRRRISPALQGARTTGSSRWLSGLVIAQMALVTAVTCSAGLLWRSLDKIAATRPAMNPDARVLLVDGWTEAPPATIEPLGNRLAGLPGVERVAWARRAMLSGSLGGAVVDVEMAGQPKMEFHFNQVSPSYFETTGARVLSGRSFKQSDGPAATLVTMVNATFAGRFFPDRQAIGEWIRVSGKDRQIVGVVEDGPSIALRETPEPYLYFPFAQMPDGELTLFIATRNDPETMTATVRSFIRSSDKVFIILRIQTLRLHMRRARSSEQLAAELTGSLAAVGLLLAAAGLFGVTLYAVAKRTPELGVRVAMGATPGALARQVLKEAAMQIAIAIPLGWALSYVGRSAIQKLLYGVAADDPWTFAVASVVVAAVGCVAAMHPALRAARIDPMTALRHE